MSELGQHVRARWSERIVAEAVFGAAGSLTFIGPSLGVTGAGARGEATDDLVRVAVGVSDPSGILTACALGVDYTFGMDGLTYGGDATGRVARRALAVTIPVATSGSLAAAAVMTASGPGRVRIAMVVTPAMQSVEVSPCE